MLLHGVTPALFHINNGACDAQALEATDRVARLRCLIEGPPELQARHICPHPPIESHSSLPARDGMRATREFVGTCLNAPAASRRLLSCDALPKPCPDPVGAQAGARDERARGALLDALGVVEFLAAFGAACEARPLRLGELQAAAAWPLDSPTLPELYQALLRCVLIEQARALGGPPHSGSAHVCGLPRRARRLLWGRTGGQRRVSLLSAALQRPFQLGPPFLCAEEARCEAWQATLQSHQWLAPRQTVHATFGRSGTIVTYMITAAAPAAPRADGAGGRDPRARAPLDAHARRRDLAGGAAPLSALHARGRPRRRGGGRCRRRRPAARAAGRPRRRAGRRAPAGRAAALAVRAAPGSPAQCRARVPT